MTALTSLLPVLLIGVLHWLMPSLVPPTVPFGVRVPGDRADEPAIAVQRRRYRVGIAAVTVAAAAGAVLGAGHRRAGLLAPGAELAACLALYLHARGRILAAKEAGDWFAGHRQVAVTDTSLRTDPERYPWRWAVPPVLLLAAIAVTGAVRYSRMPARIAVHFGTGGHPDRYAAKSVGSVFTPALAQALMTVLLLVLARVVVRGRARLDAEDPQAALRHRRFVSVMARTLLAMAAFVNLGFLGAVLATWDVLRPPGPALTALAMIPALAAAAVVVAVAVRTGQGGSRLRLPYARPGDPAVVNRDDDRFYRWGLFYVNGDDPALFVPKRFGVGWTVNLGRPLAWLLLAGTLAVLVVLPGIVR